jgi:hypothetical protein
LAVLGRLAPRRSGATGPRPGRHRRPWTAWGERPYQAITCYAAPRRRGGLGSLAEVEPEILRTYEKLGIPLAAAA